MSDSSQMKVRITSIKRKSTKKLVYNFSVEEDESYILNGVVSHNCRCSLAPASSDLEAEDTSDIEKDFDEWLNDQ